jgi:GNAT superfamily N-acetyltransferase
LIRPDRRCFLIFRDCSGNAYGPLLDVALDTLRQDVYVEVDEAAAESLRVLTGYGFTIDRREHHYAIPTDPARTGLAGQAVPDGFATISAADADVDRLRELDDALRQDVPGTAGWRNDPEEFAAQTFGGPQFDPATYLVAVDDTADDYVGLVRVWATPGGPRLGLVGVLQPYRRRGLARALLARAFDVVHERGQPEASCEVDQANTASNALLTGIGARRTGGAVELVRRHAPS